MDFDINTWAAGIGIAVITAVSVIISVLTWKKSSDSQTYSNLDTLYQEMLLAGIDNPELRVETTTTDYPDNKNFEDENFKSKYEAYALMVWSFYESVCDDAIELKDIKNDAIKWDDLEDDVNWVSYLPSFNHDARLHWRWYEKKENQSLFKKAFRDLVEKLIQNGKLIIDIPHQPI